MRRIGTRLTLLLAAAAATTFATGTATAQALTSGDGITVQSQKQLDPRLLALTVTTPALKGTANIRILLPTNYAASANKRYPVLYVFHGTSGGAADWTTTGDAEKTTAGKPLIVVMPDIAQNDNGGGWCTDWYNGGAFGLPQWERFHIDQLIPWVDANLRTISTRQERAIAGLSQGGFCSMSYAARHPDLFGTALSYSGAPDIAYDAEAQALVTPVINATETGLDQVAPFSIFGPRQTQEINWAAHDPTTLAENLAHTDMFMYTGNGQAGPFDSAIPNPGASVIESGVEQLTTMFHNRLNALGIPSLFDDYGPGTHSWPYWARDLQWSIGPLMNDFAHPQPTPKPFTYTSAENAYTIYGWTVTMHRKVEEFSTLKQASASGYQLQGSGSATVQTSASYRRHTRYRITIGSQTRTVNTGNAKRLTINTPLGPSNTVQEYPADGPAIGTTVYTTTVKIHQVPSAKKRSKPKKHPAHKKHKKHPKGKKR